MNKVEHYGHGIYVKNLSIKFETITYLWYLKGESFRNIRNSKAKKITYT